MSVRNKSKKTILADYVMVAKNLSEKMIGLLGSKTPKALLLKTRFGIHTFFLNFPIDVLILDKHNKVVCLKKNLKPFRIFLWNPKFDAVLEFPAKTIEKSKTEVEDIIDFI